MNRALPGLLLALTLGSCAGPNRTPANSEPGFVVTLQAIAPRYHPAFTALQDAVREHDNGTARRIAQQLERRIEYDQNREKSAVRERFAETGENSSPFLKTTDAALDFLRRFELILNGRERVAALELALDDSAPDGANTFDLVLRIQSSWSRPLVFEPGPATVKLHRISVTPVGQEMHSMWSQAAPAFDSLRIIPGEVLELPVGSFPRALAGSCLAQRSRWTLQLRAGEIRDEGVGYPAMNVGVAPAEITLLAEFLPTAMVAPEALATYAKEADVFIPLLMEHAVRIDPVRRFEALTLLGPIVERSTEEELQVLIPALRWLARTSGPSADPQAWKEWMRSWMEGNQTRAQSSLDIGRS